MEHPNSAVLMFIAYRHSESRIFDHLAECGYDDLTLAQGRVAARINDEGIRLTELALSAQVTKQTAGVLVDHLERSGYVQRLPDPTDARARLIVLSERGRTVRARARELEEQIEAEWEHHLGRARMRGLRRALIDLREITDPFAPT